MRGSANGDFVVVSVGDVIVPDGRSARPNVVAMLKTSIQRVGVVNPLTVTRDGTKFRLVSGMNRLTACQELGVDVVPVIVLEDGEPVREIEIDENLARMHLTAEEQAELRALEAKLIAAKRAEGKSLRAAAAEVGVDKRTAGRRSTGAGAPVEQAGPRAVGLDGKKRPATRTPPEVQEKRREAVQAAKAEGKSVREIAAEHGVSVGTVARDLQQVAAPTPLPSKRAQGSRVDADLKRLRAAWDSACEDARKRFLGEVT